MENKDLQINNKNKAKWYIVTSITGNEDTVYKNIEDKVRAYNLEDVVQEMRLLKTREITIEVFDPINNPPPSRFRNTKSITWETLPGNRYKKTRIREINRFPGYIYIKMVMADDAWYIIRNTFGVTGFVGSSGKGAKPIPMSDYEVENLFNPEMNKDIIINKTPDVFLEQTITKPREPEKKIEFLEKENDLLNDEGFFDSSLSNNKSEHKEEVKEEEITVESKSEEILSVEVKETNFENESEYLENHEQAVEEKEINEQQQDDEDISVELFSHGNSQDKNALFAIGNTVEIVSGSIQGSEGVITEIDLENRKAKVTIDILGRENVVDVDFSEIVKK
ncbi:MAG: transcription termination/antitermination protein NusG [Malacoplasma sp.]|nr:transcription termination/antitermination protein NusG [Malacoplasma sp.]